MENLTQSEKIKKEIEEKQAELDRLKAEKDKEIQDAKKIEKMRKEVEEFKEKNAKREAIVKEYFKQAEKDCPGKFKLKTEKKEYDFQAYNYVSDGDNEILATEKVQYNYSDIVWASNDKIYIQVQEHRVYSGRFSMYSSNKGYKMFIKGFPYGTQKEIGYKNIKSVVKRIEELVETHNAKVSAGKRLLQGWKLAHVELEKRFPDATVTQESVGKYYGRNWVESKKVRVVFENGLKLDYSFNYNGEELTIHDRPDIDTGDMDKEKVIEALINIK